MYEKKVVREYHAMYIVVGISSAHSIYLYALSVETICVAEETVKSYMPGAFIQYQTNLQSCEYNYINMA